MPKSDATAFAPTRRLVIFFGMTASGKSTLAQAWAEGQGAAYFNTDRVRKELVGLQATDRRPDGIGQGIYTPALSAQTYQELLARAQDSFETGSRTVVLDGSYSRVRDRATVRAWAKTKGAQLCFFYCCCSPEVTRQRLAQRAVDRTAVSDGRWEIYQHQLGSFELPDTVAEPDCVILPTEAPVGELLKRLAAQPCLQD